MNLVIYGAQAIALGAYKAIKELFPEQDITCFLVTEMENNASVLAGVPVRELAELSQNSTEAEKDEIQVLIATPEPVMKAIEKSLDEAGLVSHIRLDSLRWAHLQQLAFAKTESFVPLVTYPIGSNRADLQIYKAKFCKDKELTTIFENPYYMLDLQVGAARTEMRVAELTDDLGDNISTKNGNYSELTGLYWLWRNRLFQENVIAGKYFGLAHYRRMFDFSEDDLLRIKSNDIDVVLPYPMPYEPNMEEHHKRYLSDSEWNAVLQALDELQPEYAEAFKEIARQEYMYNYNIILAKGEILETYCSWLFPILFRVEEINDPDGVKKPNRFVGYISETLETLYFMKHKKDLKIAHAGCRFLN